MLGMDQEKLEKKVKEIFEREGFNLENGKAVKPEVELEIGVYSSEKYGEEDIDFSKDRIFVDEDFEIDNDDGVYVFEEEKNFDLPSFEMIGSIAVINDLAGRDEEQAIEGILANSNAETILLKTKELSGEYRVGHYEKLYGDQTETVHREHGIRIKVDPTKAYYSERFSTERKRVFERVKQDESVLVMFAGVGPFALLCGAKADVVAVEKNPEACKYLKENVELNSLRDKVKPYCGDVNEVVPELENDFDRVVMPLPGNALDFLGIAVDSCHSGSIIHLYGFAETFESFEEDLEEKMSDLGAEYEVINQVVCGDRSPSESRLCFDIRLK